MSQMKKAFVLMPFKEPINSYYKKIFKPSLEEAGYDVTRADDLFTPKPIMLDIQVSIAESDLILCEMTERNPNVFYELGLAHAIGKPAILVSQKKEDSPFDLNHVRVILYEPTEAGWENKLREDIKKAARSAETENEIWPPPLISGQGGRVAKQQDLEEELEQAEEPEIEELEQAEKPEIEELEQAEKPEIDLTIFQDLNDFEIDILKTAEHLKSRSAGLGRSGSTVELIAAGLKKDVIKCEHSIDRLVDQGFLYAQRAAMYPTTYGLSKKGRTYLVEKQLI